MRWKRRVKWGFEALCQSGKSCSTHKNTLAYSMSGQLSSWQNQNDSSILHPLTVYWMFSLYSVCQSWFEQDIPNLNWVWTVRAWLGRKIFLLKSQVHPRSILVDSVQASTASSVYQCSITFPAVKILLRKLGIEFMSYLYRLKTGGWRSDNKPLRDVLIISLLQYYS